MITTRPVSEHDWDTAASWWKGPFSIPRKPTPTYRRRDYTHAFEDEDGVLVAIGGLVDRDSMPPGIARLSLAVSPDVAVTDWWMLKRVQTLLTDGFAGDVTKVFGTVERSTDAPGLFEMWKWLTDRVTRDTAMHVAAGGWHHVKEGDVLDADTAKFLYLDWQKAQG